MNGPSTGPLALRISADGSGVQHIHFALKQYCDVSPERRFSIFLISGAHVFNFVFPDFVQSDEVIFHGVLLPVTECRTNLTRTRDIQ